MPGVLLHPQPCVRVKKAHKRIHHRSSRNIDIPCAMVLTGYVVLAPVRPAFVSPSFAHLCASGPKDRRREMRKLSTCR
jgi:hypothetical protein